MKRDVESFLREYSQSMAMPEEKFMRKPVMHRAVNIRRMAAIAVAALLLVGSTVFAQEISRVIKRLNHGGVSTTQQDIIVAHDGTQITSEIQLPTGKWTAEMGDIQKSRWVDVKTIEEAERLSGTKLLRPSSLPEGYELKKATIMQYETGRYASEVTLYYGKYWFDGINIEQWPLIDDAPVEVTTIEATRPTKVNGIEATLYGDESGNGKLIWIQDRMLISVSCENEEQTMQIAESMR